MSMKDHRADAGIQVLADAVRARLALPVDAAVLADAEFFIRQVRLWIEETTPL